MEQLARADAENSTNSSRLGQVYTDLGDDEVQIARNPRTPVAQRAVHWRAARSWYGRSEETRRQLSRAGKTFNAEEAIDSERNAIQLALCNAALIAGAPGAQLASSR